MKRFETDSCLTEEYLTKLKVILHGQTLGKRIFIKFISLKKKIFKRFNVNCKIPHMKRFEYF